MKATTLDETQIDVELRRVDAARKCHRLYAMTVCRSLFGEACLVITYGLDGRLLSERTEMFADEEALHRRRRKLFARCVRDGYVVGIPTVSRPVCKAPRPLAKTRGSRSQAPWSELPLFTRHGDVE